VNLDGLRAWGGLAVDATSGSPDVVVAGIAYDGSAVYRKGAAKAPQRMRELSAVMPPVTEDGTRLSGLRVQDIGDFDPGPDIELGWSAVAERLAGVPPETFLTVLGGDHCTTIATLAAQARRHPGLAVLWLDAHPDLCDFSRGGRWTCGCALRRAMETSGVDASRVVIVGGRDYDSEELDFISAHGMLLVGAPQLARDPAGSTRAIAARLAGQKLHISFDIDVLDPAFAPGTEIPSAGGLSTRQALDLIQAVTEKTDVVGFDLVEVSPPSDVGDITTLAALKMIFEVWGVRLRAARAAAGRAEGHGNS
jgi:agmatinase